MLVGREAVTAATTKLIRLLVERELTNINDDLERHRLSREDESAWSRQHREYARQLREALKELP